VYKGDFSRDNIPIALWEKERRINQGLNRKSEAWEGCNVRVSHSTAAREETVVVDLNCGCGIQYCCGMDVGGVNIITKDCDTRKALFGVGKVYLKDLSSLRGQIRWMFRQLRAAALLM